jgi:sigma-B regulation protein RsbU (phosphoserine phosphatase)
VTTAGDGCACPRDDAAWPADEIGAAARLQRALLPPSPYTRGPWSAAHCFAPAGSVGGDIVDLIPAGDDLYFLLADVSGKGIAASLLTTYLHAVFRSIVPFGLAVNEIVRRASALLCASTLPAQYATIVFGVLHAGGEVEVANAGHPPPFVIGDGPHAAVVPTGVAAGLFCDSAFGSTRLTLAPGDTLLLYSDGVHEAFDAAEREYGLDRLQTLALNAAPHGPLALATSVGDDLRRFRDGAATRDDATVLAIEFTRPTPRRHAPRV